MDAADFLRAYADQWMREENSLFEAGVDPDLEGTLWDPMDIRHLLRVLANRIEATEFDDLSPAL